ncbi:hypothetical protein Q7P37_000854 [Cladosporium fusiforme]
MGVLTSPARSHVGPFHFTVWHGGVHPIAQEEPHPLLSRRATFQTSVSTVPPLRTATSELGEKPPVADKVL